MWSPSCSREDDPIAPRRTRKDAGGRPPAGSRTSKVTGCGPKSPTELVPRSTRPLVAPPSSSATARSTASPLARPPRSIVFPFSSVTRRVALSSTTDSKPPGESVGSKAPPEARAISMALETAPNASSLNTVLRSRFRRDISLVGSQMDSDVSASAIRAKAAPMSSEGASAPSTRISATVPMATRTSRAGPAENPARRIAVKPIVRVAIGSERRLPQRPVRRSNRPPG